MNSFITCTMYRAENAFMDHFKIHHVAKNTVRTQGLVFFFFKKRKTKMVSVDYADDGE